MPGEIGESPAAKVGGNFKVVADDDFELSSAAGGDSDRTFDGLTFPPDTLVGQPSILSFMVAGNATLKATINDKVVLDARLGSAGVGVLRCYQEVCQPNILKRGGGNKVEFKVTAGDCRISDVVIWFQDTT